MHGTAVYSSTPPNDNAPPNHPLPAVDTTTNGTTTTRKICTRSTTTSAGVVLVVGVCRYILIPTAFTFELVEMIVEILKLTLLYPEII